MGEKRNRRKKVEMLQGVSDYIIKRKAEDPSLSYVELADEVNTFFNLQGTDKVSYMAVRRFLLDKGKQQIKERLVKGEDLLTEFKRKMAEIIEMTDNVLNTAKNNPEEKAREILLALEQQRRNLESLVRYGQQFTEVITEIDVEKDKKIRILLQEIATFLCPDCRLKVVQALESKT